MVSHSFNGKQNVRLPSFPTCADLFEAATDERPRICWLDFSVVGSDIPPHIVAVVTGSSAIASNWERTAIVYDSVLFQGKGQVRKRWEPPKPRQTKRSRAWRTSMSFD